MRNPHARAVVLLVSVWAPGLMWAQGQGTGPPAPPTGGPAWDITLEEFDDSGERIFLADAAHVGNAGAVSIQTKDPESETSFDDGAAVLELSETGRHAKGTLYFYWRVWPKNDNAPRPGFRLTPQITTFGQVVLIRFLPAAAALPPTPMRPAFIQLATATGTAPGKKAFSNPWHLNGATPPTPRNPLGSPRYMDQRPLGNLEDGLVLYDAPGVKRVAGQPETDTPSSWMFEFDTWLWGVIDRQPPIGGGPDPQSERYVLGRFNWKFQFRYVRLPAGSGDYFFKPSKGNSVQWLPFGKDAASGRYLGEVDPYKIFIPDVGEYNQYVPNQ